MATPVPDFNPRARYRQHAKIDAVRPMVSSRTPQFPPRRDPRVGKNRAVRTRGATTRVSRVLANVPSSRDPPNADANRPLGGFSVPPLAPHPAAPD